MAVDTKKAAQKFREYWTFRRGSEKGEDQQFWNMLLRDVLGMADVEQRTQPQVPVQMKDTVKFLDLWIPETRVLIEHKSRGIRLDAPQSGHGGKTPFEQAVEYNQARGFSEKARWIVTSNFDEIWVYDMDHPLADPQKIRLGDLPKEVARLGFLVDSQVKSVREKETDISIKAGRIVGELYKELLKRYGDNGRVERADHVESSSGTSNSSTRSACSTRLNESCLAALNRLCVRLVFLFYAEDAELFPKDAFWNFLKDTPAKFLRGHLQKLFHVLDTPEAERDPYLEPEIAAFPYTNGGLFKGVDEAEIPPLDDEIKELLIKSANFDWRDISPTIFGALFESTLNPVTRRAGGMVYTSVENIHKVIDPLFLDDLTRRVDETLGTTEYTENTEKKASVYSVPSVVKKKLLAIQDEIAALTFLDPACGSGNFLTETFLSLRRLENRIIDALQQGQGELDLGISAKVSIAQFHGIEINDFAVAVAKTAMWISEAKMLHETAEILHREPAYLPLKDYDGIIEGNALRMDWGSLLWNCGNVEMCNSGNAEMGIVKVNSALDNGCFHNSTIPQFSYIMGNPPFVGASMMSAEQKSEAVSIFGKGKRVNSIDYVGAWYYKACELISATKNTKCTKVAFVSTNSITQGEQVAPMWTPLFDKYGLEIDFAHRTFRWDSEATEKAHVHCVIIGFHVKGGKQTDLLTPNGVRDSEKVSGVSREQIRLLKTKTIFDGERAIFAANICPYLIDAPTVFIESRAKPICDVPPMTKGNYPTDDGNFILTETERDAILRDTPELLPYVRRYVGARDFINSDEVRYCLWLKDASPAVYHKNREVMRRLAAVRDFRLASSAAPTRKMAEQPWRFFSVPHNDTSYLLLPEVSSERRRYVPIGFMEPDVIAANTNLIVPNALPCHFGIITSSTHMAWMRVVAGRLKSDYRYSGAIVYNNFPWPTIETTEFTEDTEKKPSASVYSVSSVVQKITQTAQSILDARAAHHDCSLADLYDPLTMPPDLRAAHEANDRAVLAAYGLAADTPEPAIVAHLFKLYAEMAARKD